MYTSAIVLWEVNVENRGIYSITVRQDRSLLVIHRAMCKRARATFNDCANFIGYRISSFKFPLGLVVSVLFSTQYCQFHLWYRTGYRTTNVKPPFFNMPPPFSGEKNY